MENSSQLGVFWPTRGLQANQGTDLKGQYSRNQAIENGLNEATLLTPINEALLSKQNFAPFK